MLMVAGFVLIFANGCKDKEKTVPVLTTSVVTGITSISASCGGQITGGCTVLYDRGVCWSTGTDPTIADSKTSLGAGEDCFSCTMSGLTPNTTYYVRAYATNDVGTGYGSAVSFTTQQGNTVTDFDGNIYYTIVIGTQTWMLENLNVTKYRNGDAIPNITADTAWINLTTGAYCNYNNDVINAATYGRLYNWFAVNDSRNIAPAGWHVATAADWATLIAYLGGKDMAGGKMKEAGLTHWVSPNMDADNSSGFTALPGGYRFSDGIFSRFGSNGYWWSSTGKDSLTAYGRHLGTDHMDCDLDSLRKVDGLSVRCLKD
jgi:uncharacterized protein (TIGR02145 family)